MTQKRIIKQLITISEIFETIKSLGVNEARKTLSSKIGSCLEASGQILKISKRDEKVKLFIQGESLKIFADFRVKADFRLYVKKNQFVTVSGNLHSFGYDALCLNKCVFVKAENSDRTRTKTM